MAPASRKTRGAPQPSLQGSAPQGAQEDGGVHHRTEGGKDPSPHLLGGVELQDGAGGDDEGHVEEAAYEKGQEHPGEEGKGPDGGFKEAVEEKPQEEKPLPGKAL